MKKCFCDKCGEEVGNYCTVELQSNFAAIGYSLDEYQLCEECEEKLIKWIENNE